MEEANKFILQLVGGAAAILGLANLVYAAAINPQGNMMLFSAVTCMLLAALSFCCLCWIRFRKTTKPSPLDPKKLIESPYFDEPQRKKGSLISGAIAVGFLILGCLFFAMNRHADVVYDVAVVEMVHDDSTIAGLMKSIEPFPAFPFYSEASDHPTAWPPRVDKDRNEFADKIRMLLEKPSVSRAIARWESSDHKASEVSIVGQGAERMGLMQQFSRMQMYYSRHAQDKRALKRAWGPEAVKGFLALQDDKKLMVESLPNRLLILRVENRRSLDVSKFRAEIDVAGAVYDVTLNEENEQAKSLKWSPGHKVLEIDMVRPGYKAEIHVWYKYLSVKDRVFLGGGDILNEKTQGVKVSNLGISNGRIRRDKSLLSTLPAYNRYDVDPVGS